MADLPDMQWLSSEARRRWLRADEIVRMLLNHQTLLSHSALTISEKPPLLPCSGSVFFYDRCVTRNFRKDGLEWKKRKNGKTINEAHEKLKVGDKYMLNCYYAKGKENPSFRRRCYSMLEREFMHIVFVHYLDVKIACTSSALALPAVLPDPSSSSTLVLKPEDWDETFKRTLQGSIPPWGDGQLQLETSRYSFRNATSMPIDISESPSDKGYFDHLPVNSAAAGFAFQEGVENDKMPLLGYLEYPSYASGWNDHGFQDTGASGPGTSNSMRILAETPTSRLCNIDFSSEIDEENIFASPLAGLHQASMSDDLQFDDVLSNFSLWIARRQLTIVCIVMKFWVVGKAAARKRSSTSRRLDLKPS